MWSLFLLVTLATASRCVPTPWTPALAEWYSVVDKHIREVKASSTLPAPPGCDLSQAHMPTATTPLPSPAPGLVLQHVAIGRGVQNYTCAAANAQTTPVAIGAIANLYNASCIAANYPDLLSLLPNMALQYTLPAEPDAPLAPADFDLSGHHYFANPTTPTFNMDVNPALQLGIAAAKKVASSPAPSDAPKGQGGVGNGAVPWLYLSSTNGTIGDIRNVYRLNTAGGSPPATCQDSPATFSVQYAAEYWFWST